MDAFDLVIQIIFNKDYKAIYSLVILGALRPIGLLYGFIIIKFAIGPARILRVSIAIAISLPMWVGNAEMLERVVNNPDVLLLAALGLKEFMLGYGLGLFASLPFFALQYSGAIVDQFRGESESGIKDADDLPVSTFGLLYLIIGFSAFLIAGGLPNLVSSLYRSYAFWPLDTGFPSLAEGAGEAAIAIFTSTILLAIRLCLPLLVVLLTIELICYGAARIGKRFNFYENAFLLKNVVAIATLPLTAVFILSMMDDVNMVSSNALNILESIFR